MISLVRPDAGSGRAKFPNDFEKPFPGVTAVHEFEHPVAAALHREMRALNELRQPRVGRHQIIAITFRMRRSEADAFHPFDLVYRFDELDEGGFPIRGRDALPRVPNVWAERQLGPTRLGNTALAITRHDLAKQGDFLYALRHQLAALSYDIFNAAAALLAAGVGHDAESAILIAPLHDADKCRHGPRLGFRAAVQQMLANRALAPLLFRRVHNLVAATRKDVVEMIRRTMKFLRADHEIHVRQAINQFLTPALRHATQETEHDVGPVLPDVAGDILHLVDGLLLRVVAHAARVEQHDIRDVLRGRERVALGDELRGDSFAVALVHLATVSFDINARHGY